MGLFGIGRRTMVRQTNIVAGGDIAAGNIEVNGKRYTGRRAEVRDGVVYVDGKRQDEIDLKACGYSVTVVVHGIAETIDTMGDVEVHGNVHANTGTAIHTMGEVIVEGSAVGDIKTMGDVTVHGDLHGDVDTMGDVRARSFQAPR